MQALHLPLQILHAGLGTLHKLGTCHTMRPSRAHLGDVVEHLELWLCKLQAGPLTSFFLGLALQLGAELALSMALTEKALGPAGLLIAPFAA